MPATVVLIHGLWMTPASWHGWAERFRAAGHTVMTPTWPRMDHSITDLRETPSLVAGLGVEEVVDHHAKLISELPEPPIIMGHSVGGLVTQLLVDRGLGAAGVAIHPGQTKGVFSLPLIQIRAAWPAIGNPLNIKRAVALTPEQFHFAFANALTASDARAVWEQFHVPAPARPLFQTALANVVPRAVTSVDYAKSDRPPLLIVGGDLDRIVPPSVSRENHRRYRAGTVDYVEYPGRSHYTCGEPGWEKVADESIAWATQAARIQP